MLALVRAAKPSVSLLALFAAIAIFVPVIACRKEKKAVPVTVDECHAIASAAETRLERVEKEIKEKAGECRLDSECVEVQRAECVGSCVQHGIPTSHADAFNAAKRDVESKECQVWKKSHCDEIAPSAVGTCNAYRPRCVEHECTMTTNFLTAPACEKLYDAAQQDFKTALNAAAKTCRQDKDCMRGDTPTCFFSCGGPAIGVDDQYAFNTEVRRIDAQSCNHWRSAGCIELTPKPSPSCAPYIPKCTKGECTNVMSIPRGP